MIDRIDHALDVNWKKRLEHFLCFPHLCKNITRIIGRSLKPSYGLLLQTIDRFLLTTRMVLCVLHRTNKRKSLSLSCCEQSKRWQISDMLLYVSCLILLFTTAVIVNRHDVCLKFDILLLLFHEINIYHSK